MRPARAPYPATLLLLLTAAAPAGAQAPAPDEVRAAMRRAAEFMVERVATNGGYVWSYLPDLSRRWGEMEAKPTMVWVQPPGTPTMGHLFLDAYHATGDEYYYRAAEQAADALIWGQHPSGGWNYLIDFGGEGSLRHWYGTVGRNGWRLEEFQHYYGNATFDDAGTSEAAQLLLRLYVEKRDPRYRPPLERAIAFVLDSQYPVGGWPQRFPLRYDFSHHGRPDYTSYITFNDDVAAQNIKFLIMCYQALGETRVLEPIVRAMNAFLVTQQGPPQAGWALQYTPHDLQPAGARSYEPLALVTSTTADNVEQLLQFFRLTGETKFLARIPDALDWLDSVRLPAEVAAAAGGGTHPTFVEIGTNRPLFLHRRGSNVVNGAYWADHDPARTVGHYGSTRTPDVAALRRALAEARAMSPAEATRGSPLKATTRVELPRFFATRDLRYADLNSDRSGAPPAAASAERARALIAALDPVGYWPTPLTATSRPYQGEGPATAPPGDFATTLVGDSTDTSPFHTDRPAVGISTAAFVRNMSTLIEYLDATR